MNVQTELPFAALILTAWLAFKINYRPTDLPRAKGGGAGPAEQSGKIKVGHSLREVGGKVVVGLSFNEVVAVLRATIRPLILRFAIPH